MRYWYKVRITGTNYTTAAAAAATYCNWKGGHGGRTEPVASGNKWIILGPMWKEESVNKRCMELDMKFEPRAMF